MTPFETQIVRISDPLSPHGRSLRKSLLLTSLVAAAVSQTGFFPTKVSALGLEFTQADRVSIVVLLSIVVGFFLVSFVVVAAGDFVAWRMSYKGRAWAEDAAAYDNVKKELLELRGLSEADREALDEQGRRVGALWRGAGHSEFDEQVQRLVPPLSWARAAVEFVAPVAGAIGALTFLYRAAP